jgi:chromate transport protein ChrA
LPNAAPNRVSKPRVRETFTRSDVDVFVGAAYQKNGDRPLVTAALQRVAAAAVDLILATCVRLGKMSLAARVDLLFILLTVMGVNRLHQSVPRVLFTVG